MKKSVLMFSLLSGTALMFPRLTIASGLPAHTLTYTPEPKPAFQFEQPDKAYQTAAVCFLGAENCGDAGFGSMGGDDGYKVDTVQQCKNEGYSVTSCSLPAYPSGQCPYNSAYFAKCVEDRPRACKEAGFTETSCPSGYITDRTCPYDSSYITCKENPCSGYSSCECGGETGSASCYSGSIQKFESCKKCCSDVCSSGWTDTICPTGYSKVYSGKTECGNSCYSQCSKEVCGDSYQITLNFVSESTSEGECWMCHYYGYCGSTGVSSATWCTTSAVGNCPSTSTTWCDNCETVYISPSNH